jgi:hypothetical protein
MLQDPSTCVWSCVCKLWSCDCCLNDYPITNATCFSWAKVFFWLSYGSTIGSISKSWSTCLFCDVLMLFMLNLQRWKMGMVMPKYNIHNIVPWILCDDWDFWLPLGIWEIDNLYQFHHFPCDPLTLVANT